MLARTLGMKDGDSADRPEDALLNTTATPRRPAAWRAVLAASVGNALEYYDLLIYGYFAITIGKLFFPTGDDWTSLMLSVGTFGISFVMRPLGSIVLGSYADRAGRKAALTWSILLMMIGTAMLALAPTYARIGLWSPALVIVARLLQGFSTGGEFGAATAFMVEHADGKRLGYNGSWQASTQGLATVLAAGLSTVLTYTLSTQQIDAWGWRAAFLFGLLIGPIGLYIRRYTPETPEFLALQATSRSDQREVSPLRDTLTIGLPGLLLGAGVVVAVTAFSYVQKVYMPTYAVKQLHIATSASLVCTMVTGVMLMVMAPFFGLLSDRYGRIRVIAIAMIVIAVSTYPMFSTMVAYPTFATLLATQAIVGVLLAAILAPLPALLSEIFPTRTRGTGLALSYNLSVTIFGGFSPLIVTWLIGTTHNKTSPSFYVLATTLISLTALWLLRRRSARHRLMRRHVLLEN
ncbi:MFS transporter [Paraburkholderia sp. IMGN_8]|uniref:MFS transporter n=1 Tax=Paraburkholderia sp. IMGN_8 TaxID=3136564 RepID=UPI0031017C89